MGTHTHVTARNHLLNASPGGSRGIGADPESQSRTGSSPKIVAIGMTVCHPRLEMQIMTSGGRPKASQKGNVAQNDLVTAAFFDPLPLGFGYQHTRHTRHAHERKQVKPPV